MKTSIKTSPGLFFALACAALLAFAGLAQAQGGKKAKAAKPAAEKKVLVVFFSHPNNTREMAGHIQALMGADIVELTPETPYTQDHRAVVDQAKRELQADFKPRLKTKIKDLKSYDTVFVGTPNWWNSVAGPVRTFLSEYDLSGKTVVPFVTHAGSGMGGIQSDVAALCSKSTVLGGTAIWGSNAKDAREDVAKWLRRIKQL